MADNEESLTEDEFQEMYDQALLSLHLKRLDEARETADRMLAARPDSTTAHELAGDVAMASGHLDQAEDEYRKAAEIEPANADAQRKIGEVVLQRRSADFERELMQMQIEDRTQRGMGRAEPEGAAMRSGLFPGLGQLYNGEYEKGAVLAVGGMIFLGLGVNGIFDLFSPEGGGHGLAYVVVGGIGYLAVYAYSIWDAVRGAREQERLRSLYHPPGKE